MLLEDKRASATSKLAIQTSIFATTSKLSRKTATSVWQLANEDVLEEQLAAVMLQLDLIGTHQRDRAGRVPVVFQRDAIDDQPVVQVRSSAFSAPSS